MRGPRLSHFGALSWDEGACRQSRKLPPAVRSAKQLSTCMAIVHMPSQMPNNIVNLVLLVLQACSEALRLRQFFPTTRAAVPCRPEPFVQRSGLWFLFVYNSTPTLDSKGRT